MARELAGAGDGSWRISLVDIDRDGHLASFPGRHRLLTLVDGPVLGLEVAGETHVLEPHRPFAFSGDETATVSVPEGAVRALEVDVDPLRVSPFVTVLELGRTSVLPLAADQAAYVLSGSGAGSLVTGPAEVAGRCTLAVITLQRG